MLIFSPSQFKQFGKEFTQGEGFYCRYQSASRIGGFYKSLFVPLGPCCEDYQGFDNFLNWVDQSKYKKVIIELPIILDEDLKKEINKKFIDNGYKKHEYIKNEGETMLTINGQYNLNKDTRYKIRYSQKRSQIVVNENPDKEQINNAYSVYVQAAQRIGYVPKPIEAFEVLALSGCLINAYIDQKCAGFIFGYFYSILKDGKKEQICQIVLSGTNEIGRDAKLGYCLRDALINYCFDNNKANIIDALGASKKFSHSYFDFKKEFASESVPLGGCYTRFSIL